MDRPAKYQNNSQPNMPWLDLHSTEETINYLWEFINRPIVEQKYTPTENLPFTKHIDPRHISDTDASGNLAGNISKSKWIYDNKDNWFYENVLKDCAENLYFRNWYNYYNVHIATTIPPPKFTLIEMWVNYQKQHEFNPPHAHGHEAVFSFVVFMRIPTYWKEQHALSVSKNSTMACASDFQFILTNTGENVSTIEVPLSPEDEGRILFFPAQMMHQVFPFYECEEERITISGNIILTKDIKEDLQEKEVILEKMQKSVDHLRRNTRIE